jgi:hypothetical protein
MEHIGRELRKLYPPSDTPSGLRALFSKERERASERPASERVCSAPVLSRYR